MTMTEYELASLRLKCIRLAVARLGEGASALETEVVAGMFLAFVLDERATGLVGGRRRSD